MSQMTINTPDSVMAASIADDFIKQGFAFPDIKRIIFNTGKKTIPAVKDADGNIVKPAEDRTALATIIEYVDGSKVSVVNSETDPLHLDGNGRPSEQDKENGIAHALAKTLLASKIKDGQLGSCSRDTAGYGRIMRELVKSAYDQQEERAKREAAKAKAKAEHDARQAAAKANKAKRAPCLRDAVKELQETIALLRADLEQLKAMK